MLLLDETAEKGVLWRRAFRWSVERRGCFGGSSCPCVGGRRICALNGEFKGVEVPFEASSIA